MSTSDSSRFWRHAWLPVLVLGVVMGAGLWWWQERSLAGVTLEGPDALGDAARVFSGPTLSESEAALPPSSAVVAKASPTTVTTPVPAPARPPAMDRPDDFTDADWAALKMAVSRLPNGEQELVRAASFLRFQRLFDRWQALQAQPQSAERRALAFALLEQVPQRLSRGEISLDEARMVGGLLFQSVTASESLKRRLIDAFHRDLEARVPQDTDEQRQAEAQLLMEYKRRQAALVQEWQARPAESRDPTRLQRQLEEARRTLYSARP